MKALVILCLLALSVVYSTPQRGSGSGKGGSGGWGSSGGRGSLGGSSGGGKCQWVRGHVQCKNDKGKHDENHVVVRLVDSGKGTIDEGYSSKYGHFNVFGCGVSQPEVHILHFCKGNRARRLKLPVPSSSSGSYNFTSSIDLKGFHQDESDYQDHIQLPCVP